MVERRVLANPRQPRAAVVRLRAHILVYPNHFVVLGELAPHVHVGGYKKEFLVLAPSALAITAALAELSYRTVEVPFRRFGKTFGWRRPPVPMATKSVEPPKVPNVVGAVGGGPES